MNRSERRLILGCIGFGILSVLGAAMIFAFVVNFTLRNADSGPDVSASADVAEPTSRSEPIAEREPVGSQLPDESDENVEYLQLPLPAEQPGVAPDLGALFDQVGPGVVSIATRRQVTFGNVETLQAADGSGFIFDDDHIVTNNHVVANADRVIVTFADHHPRRFSI